LIASCFGKKEAANAFYHCRMKLTPSFMGIIRFLFFLHKRPRLVAFWSAALVSHAGSDREGREGRREGQEIQKYWTSLPAETHGPMSSFPALLRVRLCGLRAFAVASSDFAVEVR
jgi:hypothetical protein